MDLKMMLRGARSTVAKYSPEILMAIGITGMVTTTVLAVHATPKALRLIEEAGYCKGSDENPIEDMEYTPLTPIETVKVAWKCYIPPLTIGLLSIGCLIGANSENLRRNAALAAAYAISESTFKEYKDKVVKELGSKKEKEIKDAIAQDHIDQNPVSKNEVIITDSGNTLCYDKLSGRYFKSSADKIKKAENEINRQMRYENYVSLNEFYYLLGLDSIGIGEEVGWNIDSGYVDICYSSRLADDGTPCLVIDYRVGPQYEYNR